MVDTNIKNIILFGKTGNGKSTVGNVLVNKNNNFEEVFEAEDSSTSVTKEIKSEKFVLEDNSYKIIDTVGIGDTGLSEEEVLYKIAKVFSVIKEEGVNQVMFITSGRFTDEEWKSYNILKTVIFDNDIDNYTTIVKTKFPNFRSATRQSEDIRKINEEGGNFSKVIEWCGSPVYVDNPPIDDDENQVIVNINREKRRESRTRLITRLGLCQEIYRPRKLEMMNERIIKYVKEIESLEELLKREGVPPGELINIMALMEKKQDEVVQLMREEIEHWKNQGFFEFAGRKMDEGVKELVEITKLGLQATVEVSKNCSVM